MAHLARRLAHRKDFLMSGWIAIGFAAIKSLADDASYRIVPDHAPDRHLVGLQRKPRLLDGQPHQGDGVHYATGMTWVISGTFSRRLRSMPICSVMVLLGQPWHAP